MSFGLTVAAVRSFGWSLSTAFVSKLLCTAVFGRIYDTCSCPHARYRLAQSRFNKVCWFDLMLHTSSRSAHFMRHTIAVPHLRLYMMNQLCLHILLHVVSVTHFYWRCRTLLFSFHLVLSVFYCYNLFVLMAYSKKIKCCECFSQLCFRLLLDHGSPSMLCTGHARFLCLLTWMCFTPFMFKPK
jgi:hypothetical protein